MKYNGHRSWNAWNVSLWINNEESTYRWAVDMVKRHGRSRAANIMYGELIGQKTPDGAKYNRTCIYEALEGIND